jgi:glucokinase
MGTNGIGIDLGGTNLRVGLVTGKGSVMIRRSIPVLKPGDGNWVVQTILKECRDLIQVGKPSAVGIGVAGPLNQKTGTIFTPPNLPGLKGMALGPDVGKGLGIPAFLENDANAAAYGEWRAGAGKGTRHFLALTLGTGVGGGIVTNGELLLGADGAAGEFGHIVVDPEGLPCGCGGRGCLESYASATATARRFAEGLRSGKATLPPGYPRAEGEIRSEDVFELAKQEHAFARETLAESGRWLGIGIASLVNVFNPDAVALLGGLAGALEFLMPSILREVKARSMAPARDRVRIIAGSLGGDAGIVGAALGALGRLKEK